VVSKIVHAGGECKSFAIASKQLARLAELQVSAMQVARLTHEVGRELIEKRDEEARLYRQRLLQVQQKGLAPTLACVQVDGGRVQTRACGAGRGVHESQWKEPKVAALWRMEGKRFDEDPHPELPACFAEREAVQKLVKELKSRAEGCVEPEAEQELAEGFEGLERGSGESGSWPPQRIFRTCVASMREVYGFGPLVAAEARRRGFYEAKMKVFLGDGQETNWTIHRLHFRGFLGVLDFMHAVEYLYGAALAIDGGDAGWQRYLRYARACWQGGVEEVIAELEQWLAQHPLPAGVPLKEIADKEPSKIVNRALRYLKNNRERMNYPEYRRAGLPVTSALVESLIKEINWRLKGTEKYWNRTDEPPTSPRTGQRVGGQSFQYPAMSAESMLQVRAAVLSDDNRLEKHILSRPGHPYYRRRPADATCPA